MQNTPKPDTKPKQRDDEVSDVRAKTGQSDKNQYRPQQHNPKKS